MILLIAYDLHKPDRDYDGVENLIKSADACVRAEESVWLVDTQEPPLTWRQGLVKVASDATYFVTRLAHSWASHGLASEVSPWLKAPERTW